jgi:hypothetical protein
MRAAYRVSFESRGAQIHDDSHHRRLWRRRHRDSQALASESRHVRGLVRTMPADARRVANVDYVVGDFGDRDSLGGALQCVSRAFLVTNSSAQVE